MKVSMAKIAADSTQLTTFDTPASPGGATK